jgi:glycosyltransferase involved in cell wall biosynthesis
MKVKLLARPDHSSWLFNDLLEKNINVELDTFGIPKEGSILAKIFTELNAVNKNANVNYTFTVIHRILKKLRLGYPRYNWVNLERKIAKYFIYPKVSSLQEYQIIHYWPYWYAEFVNVARKSIDSVFVGDVHEAYQGYMKKVFKREYIKRGFHYDFHISWDVDKYLSSESNIIVPSEFVKNTYEKQFPHLNITVCEFGLRKSKYLNSYSSKNRKQVKIAYAGKISFEKGVQYIGEAIEMLNDNNIIVDIYGDFNESTKSYFLQQCDNLNFLGRVGKKELLKKLIQYDAFLLPSLSDAYSLAVMEAQSVGLPVIVSSNTGNADIIIRNDIGIVAKTECASSLAKAILEMANYSLRKHYNKNINQYFINHEELDYAGSVLQTYKDLYSC